MSNISDITVYDFENICRTCLSRKDLKPFYEKCSQSTSLIDMLKSCTIVKFAEDDGLPVKICTKCIHEINQAFSFAKRCETADRILRKCVNIKTELANNSCQSQTAEPVIKAEQEKKVDIILPRTVGDNEYVQQNIKIEALEYVEQQEEDMQIEVKQEEELIIKNECVENDDDPAEESYEEDFEFQLIDNAGSKPRFGNKLHVCSVCSKNFTRPNNLQRHMRVHTGEKPYSCVTCRKSFNSNCDLTKHKRTHTGEKPYVCFVCSKAFTDSSALKSHMRMHSGEKPYSCEFCSKKFSRKYNLNVHKRVHTE